MRSYRIVEHGPGRPRFPTISLTRPSSRPNPAEHSGEDVPAFVNQLGSFDAESARARQYLVQFITDSRPGFIVAGRKGGWMEGGAPFPRVRQQGHQPGRYV